MTLYVLVPKCSRPCGVFTIWLSVHQALWTPLPLKQHFAELQATTFSEDLPSHFSGHSGVLCCPVPPYALCFMWFLTAWPSTPLFSLQGLCLGPPSTPTPPNTSWELMSLKLSFSPHHLPAPHSRVSAEPHDLSRSQTRLAHSLLHPLCLWVGDPKSLLAKLEPWQSFSRTKPPCPVKPTS